MSEPESDFQQHPFMYAVKDKMRKYESSTLFLAYISVMVTILFIMQVVK